MSYERAIQLLKNCETDIGFVATPKTKANYNRVWARDGVICCLAAMMSKGFEKTVLRTLQTLLKHQNVTGQIPSNVGLKGDVSFGGSCGRVDVNMWLIIGVGQYVKRYNDLKFLRANIDKIKKIVLLLRSLEINDKGLLYVPLSGDWADEYVQQGYVLYDEVLYYKALQEYLDMLKLIGEVDLETKRRKERLKLLIRTNFYKGEELIYHKPMYKHKVEKPYMIAYFNPGKYSAKFCGFGNSLALHFDILTEEEKQDIHRFIRKRFTHKTKYLIPAFYPVIKAGYEFQLLKNNYLNEFKNKPYEYHNCGLWPVITGFYATTDEGHSAKYLRGLLRLENFPEYVNGKTFEEKGTYNLAWSAAPIIMVEKYIEGEKVFI